MAKLSDQDLAFFHNQGYLVARQVIPHHVIHALQDEIDRVIDQQARKLAAEGKITNLHEDAGFLHRTALIAEECREILHPVMGGSHSGPAIFNLMTCPDLLDVIGQIVGPEIIASGVYRLRPKLPFRPEGNVPWHQDSGYFDSSGDAHIIVTCWVPLMHATVEAGCMEVLPGSHRQGVYRHYWAETPAPPLSVHPDHLLDTTPVPVPANIGDAVLMTNVTCHRSTPNTSGLIRWATDLRYNAPEAGNYFPSEGSFLARSPSHPERVIADSAHFDTMRKQHQPTGTVDRQWLKQADETFIKSPIDQQI